MICSINYFVLVFNTITRIIGKSGVKYDAFIRNAGLSFSINSEEIVLTLGSLQKYKELWLLRNVKMSLRAGNFLGVFQQEYFTHFVLREVSLERGNTSQPQEQMQTPAFTFTRTLSAHNWDFFPPFSNYPSTDENRRFRRANPLTSPRCISRGISLGEISGAV